MGVETFSSVQLWPSWTIVNKALSSWTKRMNINFYFSGPASKTTGFYTALYLCKRMQITLLNFKNCAFFSLSRLIYVFFKYFTLSERASTVISSKQNVKINDVDAGNGWYLFVFGVVNQNQGNLILKTKNQNFRA